MNVNGFGGEVAERAPEQKRAAVSLLYNASDHTVLCVWNKKYDGWCLPGGKVEPGEDLLVAQARELKEETSLISHDAVFAYCAPSCVEDDRMVHVFRVPTAEGTPIESEEGCPVTWMPIGLLVESKPFGEFYRTMFTSLHLDTHAFAPKKVEKKVGEKHDRGKLRYALIPFDALKEVVRVLTKGAEKYTPGGWEFVEDASERYSDAVLRHVSARLMGERDDPEWGINHFAHAGCNILFLLALDLRGKFVEVSGWKQGRK